MATEQELMEMMVRIESGQAKEPEAKPPEVQETKEETATNVEEGSTEEPKENAVAEGAEVKPESAEIVKGEEQPKELKKKTPYDRRIDQLTSQVKYLQSLVFQPVQPGQPPPPYIPPVAQMVPQGDGLPPFPKPKPTKEQFDFNEDLYHEAVVDWKVEERDWKRMVVDRQQVMAQQQHQVQSQVATKMQQGFETYGQDEFNQVSHQLGLVIPDTVKAALFRSEMFPELVVKLGANLNEARRIAALDPLEQIYEVKALEKQLKRDRVDVSKREVKVEKKEPNRVETPGTPMERNAESQFFRKLNEAKTKGNWEEYFRLRERAGVDRK